MSLFTAIFLFCAGVLGGALNSVAGGGFIAFPALLFTGVPAIAANATQTVALWCGVTASGGAYRDRLDVPRRVMIPLLVASLLGGLVGALLLLRTPAQTFLKVLPWLMLGATLLFAFGHRLTSLLRAEIGHHATPATITGASIFELLVSVYGGYFGGGLGIMNLAMLSAIGMTDIHAMNALKSVLGSAINGVAVITFFAARAVYIKQAAVMTLGAITGGWFGAHYAQKLPPAWIRSFVILVGGAMSLYFFYRAYRV